MTVSPASSSSPCEVSIRDTRSVAEQLAEVAEVVVDEACARLAHDPLGGDAGAAAIRSALGAGGHATLVRAPDAVRAAVPVFQRLMGG